MGHRKFWAEDTDTHGRWGEYRHARAAERGTRVDRGPDPDDRSPRAELPSGGYQRPDVEGRRAYSPGERGARAMTGQRGLPEGAAEEIAAPFDEERILDRVDRDHRGRGPRGWRRPDARIEEEVNERLTDDPHLDASAIEVGVQDGEVTLLGTVESRSARRRAEDTAEQVRGVSYVQNNLRARDPFYHAADREAPPETLTGHEAAPPTGAGSDASAVSATGTTGMTAGTGATGTGGDSLLGAEETRGRRYAKAPVDEGAPGG
jgi:osmotically-inducible protein OsmY